MNYAFYIVFGDMAYETWQMMCTEPESAEKQTGQWGQKHISQSGPNSAVILAQISDEEKLTTHMLFARKMATEMGMHHEIYKLIPDDR